MLRHTTRHFGSTSTESQTLHGMQDVTVLYTLGRVLGRGQFGTTRLAVQKATGKEFACKSIGKRKLLCGPAQAVASCLKESANGTRATACPSWVWFSHALLCIAV